MAGSTGRKWALRKEHLGPHLGKMRIYVLEVLLLKKWLDIWQQMKSNWKCQTKAQEMKSEMEVKKMDPLHTAL
jgi:hypothetical protein